MRVGRTLRSLSGIGALLLTLSAGCTISIQPWSKPVTIAPSTPVELQPPNPNGPFPQPRPGGMLPLGAFGSNNETITVINAKLQKTEDELGTMHAHLVSLKRDKTKQDDLMSRSSVEIDETLKQLKKLRQELSQWKADVDEMNNRIETLEKTRGTMKLLLEQMGAYMEREARNTATKAR